MKIDRFLSGDHVVKDKNAAATLSEFSVNPPGIGIEMEGLGVAEALDIVKMINGRVIKGTGSRSSSNRVCHCERNFQPCRT